MPLRIAFLGTPDFSVPVLAALLQAGHNMAAVYSRPPRKSGRGMAEQKTPVHLFARERGLPVRLPSTLKTGEEQQAFMDLDLDLAVVVAYGLLLPVRILEAPRYGCINLHASLLPRWRGAAPIQRAIMAGDTRTGIMVMQMDAGLDTGPVLAREAVPVRPTDTAGDLHTLLSRKGARLVTHTVAAIESGQARAVPQKEDGASYARKITRAETRIDWRWSAQALDCHIRGLAPFPGAFFEVEKNGKKERVKVLSAQMVPLDGKPGTVLDGSPAIACGTKALRLITVQRAGKAPMSAAHFQNGFGLVPGQVVE